MFEFLKIKSKLVPVFEPINNNIPEIDKSVDTPNEFKLMRLVDSIVNLIAATKKQQDDEITRLANAINAIVTAQADTNLNLQKQLDELRNKSFDHKNQISKIDREMTRHDARFQGLTERLDLANKKFSEFLVEFDNYKNKAKKVFKPTGKKKRV